MPGFFHVNANTMPRDFDVPEACDVPAVILPVGELEFALKGHGFTACGKTSVGLGFKFLSGLEGRFLVVFG